MSKLPVLIELQYLPPIHVFGVLLKQGLVLEAQETYQKRSLRNKCLVATDQGPKLLTVPLLSGKHEAQDIREVRIAYHEDWVRQHLRTLTTYYHSAPFFDHYFPAWEELLQQHHEFLWDLNWQAILLACVQLDLPVRLSSSLHYEVEERFRGLRDQLTPRNYREFWGPHYMQVYTEKHGFLKNLCILDLIFCCGPAGRLLLAGV